MRISHKSVPALLMGDIDRDRAPFIPHETAEPAPKLQERQRTKTEQEVEAGREKHGKEALFVIHLTHAPSSSPSPQVTMTTT